jgi:hypothetical protein
MRVDTSCAQAPEVVLADRQDRSAQLRAIADDYIRQHRRRAERELASFRALPTDEVAVSHAALGQLADGQPHPHQYRVPRNALRESCHRLLRVMSALAGAPSFDELLDIVAAEIEPIDGIGELAVYDTSLRIGARFGHQPIKIHLHRGTREGAKALGLPYRQAWLGLADLPNELRVLSPREAEDALCIYEREFAMTTGGASTVARCAS